MRRRGPKPRVLFTALVFLYRDRGKGERVVAALAIRVVLSASLVAFLVIAYKLGWIAPGGPQVSASIARSGRGG